MYYRTFVVVGPPRCGNHYLGALIAKNFWGKARYNGHCIGHRLDSIYRKQPACAIFYIWRSFDSMARSLFRVRGSFKLCADDYDSFVTLPISELFDPTASAEMESNLSGICKLKTFSSAYFRQFTGTLRDFWKHHIDTWTAYEDRNIKYICYDELLKDFHGTMRGIAEFLGSDKRSFEDVKVRVGWFPPGEGWTDRPERDQL